MRATTNSDYRDWYETKHSQTIISDWVPLSEGEEYYFEVVTYEGSGGDHMSTAVEIEESEIFGHHHTMKEVQMVYLESA